MLVFDFVIDPSDSAEIYHIPTYFKNIHTHTQKTVISYVLYKDGTIPGLKKSLSVESI